MSQHEFSSPEIAEMAAEISALRCALHALMHLNEHGQEAVMLFEKLSRQWQGSFSPCEQRHFTALQRQLAARRPIGHSAAHHR